MRKIFVLLAILLLAIALVGCEEEGEVKETSTRPAVSGAEEGAADVDVEEAGEGDSFAGKFTDFVTKKAGLQFTVTYDFRTESGQEVDEYTMTQYFGGPGRYRMDGNFDGDEGRFYIVDDKMTSCSKEDGEWTCITIATGEPMMQDPTEQFTVVEENPDEYDIGYSGTKKIAGTTAYCYGIDYAYLGANAEMEYCFSKEGIPLYMRMESPDFFHEMKAKSFKKGVSGADFNPPVEPIDYSAMYAQYGAYQ